jgi:hypothetical protein
MVGAGDLARSPADCPIFRLSTSLDWTCSTNTLIGHIGDLRHGTVIECKMFVDIGKNFLKRS